MTALNVIPIPALKDNYIWLLRSADSTQCAVVDPGDAVTVIAYLEAARLELGAILITHHHADHTAGLPGLKQAYPGCRVYGPQREGGHLIEQRLARGMRVRLPEPEVEFEVLDIPGHTLGHIAYYSESSELLFCGDTLFSAGCGRLFEGTAEQMYESLLRLAALPAATQVYCGHEYTLKNIAFAMQVEPGNDALRAFERRAVQLREAQKPTLPTRICDELSVNPFLRAHVEAVRDAAQRHFGMPLSNPVDVFRSLRSWKDAF
ncbi:MAG TPA: hydroxyacylglutathione hydrolase [Gammaproteobacteria bacterium]|nr:hydroxyacylglutathione hydrolase [Gammaproteobacteria bacterium]